MTRFAWRSFDALTVRELHDLLRLRAEVFVVEQRCIFVDIDGRDPEALHLLARSTESAALLGTLRLFPPDLGAGQVRIGRVAATSSARGTGLGRAMMVEGLAETERRFGPVPVGLEAQSRLEGFYRSLGFARASDDYEEDGILHCAMVEVLGWRRPRHSQKTEPSNSQTVSPSWLVPVLWWKIKPQPAMVLGRFPVRVEE